ncbi:unnamed protein product [Fusarium graminearum]|nr:unnamed protein product [Fusarium graminearum]
MTDHWMNSYGCYLRNARTSLIICCRRLLMRDGRHQLNILRKVLAVNSTATNCDMPLLRNTASTKFSGSPKLGNN